MNDKGRSHQPTQAAHLMVMEFGDHILDNREGEAPLNKIQKPDTVDRRTISQ
jgi:hypothetical protein